MAEILSVSDRKTIAEHLEKLGYRAKIDDKDDSIESATSGLKFFIRVIDNESIQFSVGVETKGLFSYEDANAFNKKYRFAKVYIDDDKDIILIFDLPIVGMDLATLERCMLLWDGLISALLREVQPNTSPTTGYADNVNMTQVEPVPVQGPVDAIKQEHP